MSNLTSRKKLIAAIAIVIIILVSAVGYAYYQQMLQTQKEEERRSTLYLGTTETIEWLDGTGTSGLDNLIGEQIYEGLVAHDPNTAALIPRLAESLPTVSSDRLTYTFHLRKGITFHDGTPLTAQAILDSYLRITTHPERLANDIVFAHIDLKSSRAIDDHTLELRLHQPFSLALSILAAPSVLINKPGPSLDELTSKDLYIGTGPWKFDHWTRGTEIVLTRNDNYWDKERTPMYLKTLVFKLYRDPSAMVLDLKSHALDAAWPSFQTTDIESLKADSQFKVIPAPTGRNIQLTPNLKLGEGMGDLRVRQALAYAIDRSDIISRVYKGVTAKEQLSIVPESFPGYFEAFEKYPHNPDKARQLLQEAGYPNGIDVTLLYSTRDAHDTDIAVVLQSQLSEVGIRLKLQQMEHGAFIDAFMKGQFELLIGHWVYDYYDAAQYMITFSANQALGGYWTPWTGYSSSEADELVTTMLGTTDESSRLQMYKQLQEIIADDVVVVPIGGGIDYLVVWTTVQGLQLANPFFATSFAVTMKTA